MLDIIWGWVKAREYSADQGFGTSLRSAFSFAGGVKVLHNALGLLHPLKFNTMIKKIGTKWYVLSEKTGKSLGGYRTRKETMKRLGQVEFFKNNRKKFFRKLKMTKGIKEGRKGKQ